MVLFIILTARFGTVRYFNGQNVILDDDGKDTKLNVKDKELKRVCNLPFSDTGLEQYEQYNSVHKFTHSKIFKTRNEVNEWHRNQTVNFNVTVDSQEYENTFYLAVYVIGNYSNGGASFKLNFEGNQLLVSYSVKDDFNGTYHGCYVIPKDCFTLTVRLLFVQYAAYYDLVPCPLTTVIYKNSWCPVRNRTNQPGKPQMYCKNYTSNTVTNGIWILQEELFKYSERFLAMVSTGKTKINIASNVSKIAESCLQHLTSPTSFKWFWKDTEQNCVIQQNDLKSRWERCLGEYSAIYLVGDSHTRGIYSYITKLFGAKLATQKTKWNDNHFNNLHYIHAGFITTITKVIHNLLASYNKFEGFFKPTVVILGFSSWDLQIRSFSDYFKAFHLFEKILPGMVQLSKVSNIKWIYMTRPSVWDNSTCVCDAYRKGRNIPNIFSVAAINEFTIQKLRELGLDFQVFDYYTLTVHRNNEVADHIHYLYEWLGSVQGSVGTMATDVLLTQLCPSV